MAYNNGFPVGYPYYQPVQPYQQQMQQAPQTMTPPTIHAEILQVEDEAAASRYPVAAGASQMMIARDDSAIFVKSVSQNGTRLDVFVKRPPAPQKPPFDPSAYVRRDEIAGIISDALNGLKTANEGVTE